MPENVDSTVHNRSGREDRDPQQRVLEVYPGRCEEDDVSGQCFGKTAGANQSAA